MDKNIENLSDPPEDEEEESPECCVLATVKLLARKWITYIVSELLVNGEMNFTELQKRLTGVYGESISARVLSDSLSLLEKHGIVKRVVIEIKPFRTQYSLTKKGEDLRVVFMALKSWGAIHGGVKYKKCRTFTCIHDTVPILDLDKANELIIKKITEEEEEEEKGLKKQMGH